MAIIQPLLTTAQPPDNDSETYWWQQKSSSCNAPDLKLGDKCPACKEGTLDYDSLFLLTCDQCGQVAESGAFT